MYNLLMRQSEGQDAWEYNQGKMYDVSDLLGGRVFEHTETAIKEQFTGIDGQPDYPGLIKLPCLFTYEGFRVTGAIGQITKVVSDGGVFQIMYFLPDVYPRIPMNEDRVFDALGIGRLEKGRTHWAVKDLDLFETVLRVMYGNER